MSIHIIGSRRSYGGKFFLAKTFVKSLFSWSAEFFLENIYSIGGSLLGPSLPGAIRPG
jgi:hypothetical protein